MLRRKTFRSAAPYNACFISYRGLASRVTNALFSAGELMANQKYNHVIPVRLRCIILGFDILALLIAYWIALNILYWIPQISEIVRFEPNPEPFDNTRFYYYTALGAAMLTAFANKGHYTRRVPWWGQVQFILKAVIITLVIDGFTFFSLQIPFSRFFIIFNWAVAAALLIVFRQLSFILLRQSKDWRLHVVLIADGPTVTDTMYAFYADGHTGYEVKVILLRDNEPDTFSLDFLPKAHPAIELIPVGKQVDIYTQFIHENPNYFYILSLDGFRGKRRDALMAALEDTNVHYAIIPPIKRLHLHGMEPHYFFGNDIMLLQKRYKINTLPSRMLKRGMDIALSGLALIPLGILTAAMIVTKRAKKLDSPVFYGGVRVGLHGESFPCWKFNTMHVNADAYLAELLEKDPAAREEWNTFQKLKNDPRIDTRLSALLRKTSLDELPQLWNVFVGDMSLVGPRPILEDQKADYGESLKRYESVRPGLTGLWQVSGRNETSFQRRVYWDNWYIRNWSLWHDVVIIFKTVRVFLTGSGAY